MMKKEKTFVISAGLLAQAGEPPPSGPTTKIGEEAAKLIKIQDIGVLISKTISGAIIAAALLTLGYLIWGGIDLIISTGDKAKLETARNKITAALIGLAIVAVAWAVWKLVIYFFGIGVVGQGAAGRVFFKFSE